MATSTDALQARKWAAWTVLVEECGARRDQWDEFAFHFPQCGEFRFMGSFGFGGKVYSDGRGQRWWVGCYREDTTPERQAAINRANERLQAL